MEDLFNILEDAQNVVQQSDPLFNRRVASPGRSLSPIRMPNNSMNHNHNNNNNAQVSPTFYTAYQDMTPLALPRSTSAKQPNKSAKKRTWKKPKDKPKRPLSAYNLFFQQERTRIIAAIPDSESTAIDDGIPEEIKRKKHRKTHGKIGFADLARSIADKWKCIDPTDRVIFEEKAETEKQRYKLELDVWTKTKKDSGELVKKKKSKPAKKKLSSSSSSISITTASTALPSMGQPSGLAPPVIDVDTMMPSSSMGGAPTRSLNSNSNRPTGSSMASSCNRSNQNPEALAHLLVKGSSYRYQMLQQMTNAFLHQQQKQQRLRQQLYQQQQQLQAQRRIAFQQQQQQQQIPLQQPTVPATLPLIDGPDETFSSATFFEEVEEEQQAPPDNGIGDDMYIITNDFGPGPVAL